MSRAEDLLERIAILLGRSDEREATKQDPGILKGRIPTGWKGATELVTGQSTPVNLLSANFPESGSYTIEFNLLPYAANIPIPYNPGVPIPPSPTPNPTTNQPIVAKALVQWSVEGSTVTRIMNIVDGASITGVAQGVNVFAFDATQEVKVESSPFGVPYQVTAQVSKGVRATNKQPPILVPGAPSLIGSVLIDATDPPVSVPIPQGAGVISVYVTVGFSASPEPDSNSIQVQQQFALTLFSTKTYDPRDFPDWVPISPGADTIFLVNNSAQEVVFSITFGIDG